nr:3317_t:CDS:2 [Entrophospora candida]
MIVQEKGGTITGYGKTACLITMIAVNHGSQLTLGYTLGDKEYI